jgi:hypothetical protein
MSMGEAGRGREGEGMRGSERERERREKGAGEEKFPGISRGTWAPLGILRHLRDRTSLARFQLTQNIKLPHICYKRAILQSAKSSHVFPPIAPKSTPRTPQILPK